MKTTVTKFSLPVSSLVIANYHFSSVTILATKTNKIFSVLIVFAFDGSKVSVMSRRKAIRIL